MIEGSRAGSGAIHLTNGPGSTTLVTGTVHSEFCLHPMRKGQQRKWTSDSVEVYEDGFERIFSISKCFPNSNNKKKKLNN
jgi:hypothetical protein